MVQERCKQPTNLLFDQRLFQDKINKNKAPHYWPFVRRIRGWIADGIPPQRANDGESVSVMLCFHYALQWRHNERDGVSNHRRLHCLLNCWFRHRSKKISKLRVTGLAGNSPVTGEFLAQKSSNAENVSIWWRHHDILSCTSECAPMEPDGLNVISNSVCQQLLVKCVMWMLSSYN